MYMPARVDSSAPEALISEAICRTNGELHANSVTLTSADAVALCHSNRKSWKHSFTELGDARSSNMKAEHFLAFFHQ